MKKELIKQIENILDEGFAKHIPLTAEYLADKLINVLEVKQGKWEVIDFYNNIGADFLDAKCSVCGYTDCFDESGFYNYCPNCGAKMDEERKCYSKIEKHTHIINNGTMNIDL